MLFTAMRSYLAAKSLATPNLPERETRLLEEAHASLATAKESARRQRLLDAGTEPAEADRRLAQARASREMHLRVIEDPERRNEIAAISEAQSAYARRMNAAASAPSSPSQSHEEAILEVLRSEGAKKAIDVARAVFHTPDATIAAITPILYRLAARKLVSLGERGWEIVHPDLDSRIVDVLGGDGSFNALELSALLCIPLGRIKSALDGLVEANTIEGLPFATPSGLHQFYHCVD